MLAALLTALAIAVVSGLAGLRAWLRGPAQRFDPRAPMAGPRALSADRASFEWDVSEPDFMLERCTRLGGSSQSPMKLEFLLQRSGFFAGPARLSSASPVVRWRTGERARLRVLSTHAARARALLSNDLERTFALLPRGAALQYVDGRVWILLPGRERRASVLAVAREALALACRWVTPEEHGYR